MAILGLHVKTDENNDFAGHAWISVTESGVTSTYSLYPKTNPVVTDDGQQPQGWNGSGTEVYKNLDNDRMASVEAGDQNIQSVYREMSPEDQKNLEAFLNEPQKYATKTNNCTNFAAEAYVAGGGERYDVNGSVWRGGYEHKDVPCPNGLRDSIQQNKVVGATASNEAENAFNAEPPPAPPKQKGELTQEFNEVAGQSM
jgi:hypothetical protein